MACFPPLLKTSGTVFLVCTLHYNSSRELSSTKLLSKVPLELIRVGEYIEIQQSKGKALGLTSLDETISLDTERYLTKKCSLSCSPLFPSTQPDWLIEIAEFTHQYIVTKADRWNGCDKGERRDWHPIPPLPYNNGL